MRNITAATAARAGLSVLAPDSRFCHILSARCKSRILASNWNEYKVTGHDQIRETLPRRYARP